MLGRLLVIDFQSRIPLPMTDKKDQFACPAPWTQLTVNQTGYLRPCCWFSGKYQDSTGKPVRIQDTSLAEFWNSDVLQENRKLFLTGKAVEGCERCYKSEARGGISRRQHYFNLVPNFEDLIESKDKPTLLGIDLRHSNLCNQKCITCDPYHSSKWRKEMVTNRPDSFSSFLQSKLHLSNAFSTNFDVSNLIEDFEIVAPNLREVYLTGGETTLNQDFVTLLKRLSRGRLNNHSEPLTIRFNTNASFFNEEFYGSLVSIPNVKVKAQLSIDATGTANDYLRFPTKFEEIESTIRKLSKLPKDVFKIEITPVVSALNILSISDMFKWRKKSLEPLFGLPPYIALSNFVYEPENMQLTILSKIAKAKAIESLQESYDLLAYRSERKCLEGILHELKHSSQVIGLNSLRRELSYLDSIRGTDHRESFPHLYH